jgi:5-(carboxyamino)imidazole ribonucleotide synthase
MLGGGQLGRMFALAARQCGYRVIVFGDAPDSPAGQVADRVFSAGFDDLAALTQLASQVEVVTLEQENIPLATLEHLASRVPVHPSPALVRAAQNRLIEKRALRSLGIATADFAEIKSFTDLEQARASFGDVIVKTATLGYDGKGQIRVRPEDALEVVWRQMNTVSPWIAEKVVLFDFELSIVASRFAGGACAFYEPAENEHVHHILDLSVSPSPRISAAMADEARAMARAILEHFDVYGVLCVEFFAAGGRLLVNEIAPRPHNSGHLTINACRSSQFEQQFRAVCGLPSGDVRQPQPAAMIQLLGDHIATTTAEQWQSVFALPDVHVHLYGKAEARTRRKMGHLTATADSSQAAIERVRFARQLLTPHDG